MSRAKKEARQKEMMQPGPDQLAMEIGIRRRYCDNWPSVIVELSKRVQGVNQSWQQIMTAIMLKEGLRVTYAREDQDFVVTVSYNGVVEQHRCSIDEFNKAAQYIEVLVMDKLKDSLLIKQALTGE